MTTSDVGPPGRTIALLVDMNLSPRWILVLLAEGSPPSTGRTWAPPKPPTPT